MVLWMTSSRSPSTRALIQEAAANSTSGMGIDKGSYPCSKKVVLGFNIEF